MIKKQLVSAHILARIVGAGWCRYVALLVCCATSQIWAASTTIVSEDFESYSGAATNLTDTADANPRIANGVIVDDNPIGGVNGSGIQLINWLAHSGSQSLLLRSGTEAQLNLVNARSGSKYTLDFWLYSVRQATSDRGMYVILRGEGSDINGDDYLAYRVDRGTSTKLFYYDGVGPGAAAWVSTGTNHTPEVWQHHRFVIDANALTFSFYLDDMTTPVLAGADLSRVEVGVPTLIRLVNEGNSADDDYFAIDDLSLTVEGAMDLATTFTDGFETYPARTGTEDDADPQGPWITTEVDGTGSGKPRAPGKVQVVDSTVVTPHSGTKCLKLEGGQRAGASIAWGVPPLADVQVTWWARVPASFVTVGSEANYLRMSLYGAENGNSISGDNALLGYGVRNATVGDSTSLTYYTTGWLDSGIDYTPDTWEQYRLTTHTSQGRYTIIKNPNSATPQVVADRAVLIGSATNWAPVFMAAWSSSNGTNHPPVYIDDIEIKSLLSNAEPLGEPYSITNFGNRFTNWTILSANAPVGRPAIDPRDKSILFTVDVAGGGIYRAEKVASGNWRIDPQPIVAGLDRPSGLAIEPNGTIWWTHDYNNDFTRSLARLKAPWASNSVETIIADIGDVGAANRDDDAIDVTVAPASFNGSLGQPGMIVVADRGVDGEPTPNGALYLVDPRTTSLDQTNYNSYLVSPSTTIWGSANLTAIASLPASGEVAALALDGTLVAVDANGITRYINAYNLWPLGAPASAVGIAVDPISGKIWGADDIKDEIWSIDSSSGADQKEIGFPLTDTLRTDRQIALHDPGMAFAPDGSFMVITDASTSNGTGGRLIVFHNEAVSIPTFAITSAKVVGQTFQLNWQSAGGAKYRVQRGTNLGNLQDVTGDLTQTQFTDTNTVGNAFYRVVAKP